MSNEPNFLEDDPAYQCWSEVIEKQDQQQQDAEMVDKDDYQVIDLSQMSWPEVLAKFNATKA